MRYLHLLFLALLTGCEATQFYYQAARGQMQIVSAREPVSKVLSKPSTSDELKAQLILSQQAVSFSKDRLGLNPDGNFSDYVDLGRDYVVWNVFATDEFSLKPMEWCFPIAGCVAYRGYFQKSQAVSKAKALKAQGKDVHVGGVRAYSTLGWFRDPLMNTFIHDDEAGLVGLIFHELAHKKLYIKGDTTFNESFATAVEWMGLTAWFAEKSVTFSIEDATERAKSNRAFYTFLLGYMPKLNAIYHNAAIDETEKRQQKAAMMNRIFMDYMEKRVKAGWSGYEQWLKTLNNAKLSTVSNYHSYTQAFIELKKQTGSFEAFYKAAEILSKLPRGERIARLQTLEKQASVP